MALFVISACSLTVKTIILLSRSLRFKLLFGLAMPNSMTGKSKQIMKDKNVGDWYILYKLGRNLNPTVFKQILNELNED